MYFADVIARWNDRQCNKHTCANESSKQRLKCFLATLQWMCTQSNVSIYIETDKPMYKPGDRVRFRIVSVRMDTLTESSEVRGVARGVETPIYYNKVVVKKPSRRVMAMWINKSWQQGFEVSFLDRVLCKIKFKL